MHFSATTQKDCVVVSYFCGRKQKNKAMKCTVIIEKDEKSGWYAGQCCEFPEALSQGKNIDELMDNMKEAISLIVEYKRDKTIAEYKGQKVIRRYIEI